MTSGITLLGSTGSIGVSTLQVVELHRNKFHIEALSAHSNVELLLQQCQQFLPKRVVMVDGDSAEKLCQGLKELRLNVDVQSGEAALSDLSASQSEIVVCGIVGAAGLMSTLAAVQAARKVLIANKEPLVMMGRQIVELAAQTNASLLPVDSEHNAIFQCLPQQQILENRGQTKVESGFGVKKIMLTGSGGPFRTLPLEQMSTVSPEQACAHPNWQMGRKISVDSATMMNKGLELIEACALFGLSEKQIEIVIHPQSVIHSMVEYIDGTVLAQMASPDMRVPIANAMSWPHRIESGAEALDFSTISQFQFEKPDYLRFPALGLAREAARRGGTLPAIMNAANEIAVESFLQGAISFDRIVKLVEQTMSNTNVDDELDVESVLRADKLAREHTEMLIHKHAV